MENAIDLSRFDEPFSRAQVEDRFEDGSVPDGVYQVKIDRIYINVSKKTGMPILKWGLKIIGPTHKGTMIWKTSMVTNDDSLKWIKKDLYNSGLKIEKFSDLPESIGQLLDAKLEVVKSTKGQYENIYIKKRLSEDDAIRANNGSKFF